MPIADRRTGLQVPNSQGPLRLMEVPGDDVADIVQILASKPSEEELISALKRFDSRSSSPTQSSASIVFTLVNTTIPELWRSLASNRGSKETVRLITECLSSVAGVNALLMRLDILYREAQKSSIKIEQNQLGDVLQVLTLILKGDRFSLLGVIELCRLEKANGKLLFNEYVALVGGSRILNVVSKVAASMDNGGNIWIAEGKAYSRWLGKRIGEAIIKFSDGPEVETLLGKSLSLGYPCMSLRHFNNSRLGHRRFNAYVHT